MVMRYEEFWREMLPVNQLVFPIYHQIIADGVMVYAGYSNKKAWWASLRAAKSGAKYVSRLANSVETAFSRALD